MYVNLHCRQFPILIFHDYILLQTGTNIGNDKASSGVSLLELSDSDSADESFEQLLKEGLKNRKAPVESPGRYCNQVFTAKGPSYISENFFPVG